MHIESEGRGGGPAVAEWVVAVAAAQLDVWGRVVAAGFLGSD
jgi:hypothetical protein